MCVAKETEDRSDWHPSVTDAKTHTKTRYCESTGISNRSQ
jgi:hypothetical protein